MENSLNSTKCFEFIRSDKKMITKSDFIKEFSPFMKEILKRTKGSLYEHMWKKLQVNICELLEENK